MPLFRSEIDSPPVWWRKSHRSDPLARPIADRHYNRQTVGATGFVPPGRCLVFLSPRRDALWVTSWPFPEFVKHEWPGAWICSCFRRESGCPHRASALILMAEAATKWEWGEPPDLGFITFVDKSKVKPTMIRGEPVWGFCYLKAGWEPCGTTKGGLLAFRKRPQLMSPPAPLDEDRPLFGPEWSDG